MCEKSHIFTIFCTRIIFLADKSMNWLIEMLVQVLRYVLWIFDNSDSIYYKTTAVLVKIYFFMHENPKWPPKFKMADESCWSWRSKNFCNVIRYYQTKYQVCVNSCNTSTLFQDRLNRFLDELTKSFSIIVHFDLWNFPFFVILLVIFMIYIY